ncbi:hypothetical protein Taro_020337 [Colocasia esculenta]|uniref:Uncharacterized protein n=1 Tax=Colocasia esculenta TaxID=4460 RepID=A0A843V868_COLES|nr:hypothetical protein [Colocasia esculenta]
MTIVISSTLQEKCGSKLLTSAVRKDTTVGNSVRLHVVTTTRLATQIERTLPGQETIATEATTTRQPVRVHDSSNLVAPNAPSKAHEDGGPRQTVTTSLTRQALRCRAPGERLV